MRKIISYTMNSMWSSNAAAVKEVGPAGKASLAVADDKHEGAAAMVVSGSNRGKRPLSVVVG
jgi:hypothetical protein